MIPYKPEMPDPVCMAKQIPMREAGKHINFLPQAAGAKHNCMTGAKNKKRMNMLRIHEGHRVVTRCPS